MDQTTVYTKTDRGRDEIRTRSLGLPAQLRVLLIATDGKHRVDELGAMYPRGNVFEAFAQLLKEGLIEPVGAALDARAAAARESYRQATQIDPVEFAPDLETIPDIGGEPLDALIHYLESVALEMMGRDAQRFSIRLSMCVSLRHVYSLMPELRSILKRRRGPAAAEVVAQRVLQMMADADRG